MVDVGNVTFRVTATGFQQLDGQIKQTNGHLRQMGTAGNSMKGLAARFVGLQALVTGAIQGFRKLQEFVGQSIEKFREFENRMAEVSTILSNLTMNQIPALTGGIETLSTTFGKSANDLANGLYDILSAAIAAEDSMRLLNTATKASIAGLTTVSTSVDVFTSILNAYGKTVAQAANISDVLFQTVVRGKLRFEDLASAMGYIAPIAANAGVAFEEVAAALATVTRQGLHVDMASRGLALMLQGIVNPAKAAGDAARKYGIDMSGLALRVKGLKGFMLELNEATEEHGMTILPQIIRNMRSLRVAMALAGEEGVIGFRDDLDKMANAAGKTEDALTKMMNTEQRNAEILAQSFELVERRIGEAWSGADMWWRKAKLWWATFLTGGDGSAAVSEVEGQIDAMNSAMMQLVSTNARVSNKDPLSKLLLNSDDVGSTLKEMGELSGAEHFLDLSEQLVDLSDYNVQLDMLKKNLTKFSKWDSSDLLNLKSGDSFDELPGGRMTSSGISEVNASIIEYNALVDEDKKIPLLESGAYWDDLIGKIDAVNAALETSGGDIDALILLRNAAQGTFDYTIEGFQTIQQSIASTKQNILELASAIKELKQEVGVEGIIQYTAKSGDEFEGMLQWELAKKKRETELDRFETFASRATKYGTGMDEYIAQYGELDVGLSEAINTIYEYNQAVEEQKQAELELQAVLDENLFKMRQNSLEKMKIQLMGMMRRRGNTRAEMKMMKRLDMENLKLRIENMSEELEHEEEFADDVNATKEAAYEAANRLLEEYIDNERHNLWLLTDIRDDEVRDLEETIKEKKEQLEKYEGWFEESMQELSNLNAVYIAELKYLADKSESLYKKLFDTEYLQTYMEDMQDLLDMLNVELPEPSGGGGSDNDYYSGDYGGYYGAPGDDDDGGGSGGDDDDDDGGGNWGDPWVPFPSRSPGSMFAGSMAGRVNAAMRRNFHRGTNFVPHDMMAMVHRGEQIIPSGANSGSSGDVNVNITVTGNTITDTNANTIAAQIGDQVQKALVDNKTGKSKYRMR